MKNIFPASGFFSMCSGRIKNIHPEHMEKAFRPSSSPVSPSVMTGFFVSFQWYTRLGFIHQFFSAANSRDFLGIRRGISNANTEMTPITTKI
jgi:hypothetical protein